MLKTLLGMLFLLTAFVTESRADYRWGNHHCHEWGCHIGRGYVGPSIRFGYNNGQYYGHRGQWGHGGRRDYYGRGRYEHRGRGDGRRRRH